MLRCHAGLDAGRICRSNRVLRELNATPGETGRWRGCPCRDPQSRALRTAHAATTPRDDLLTSRSC